MSKWMGFAAAAVLATGTSAAAQQPGGGGGGVKERVREEGGRAARMMMGEQKELLREFVHELHSVNKLEIQTGQIAVQKAQHEDVKRYAQSLVEEHRALDQKLTEFARKNNIALEKTGEMNLSDLASRQMKQKLIARLNELDGREFDLFFISTQIGSHQWATSLLEASVKHLENQQAKEMAQNALEQVQDHLKQAKQIGKQLAGEARRAGR